MGFASGVTGGDGGAVVVVSTLADSGPGSLRDYMASTSTLIIEIAPALAGQTLVFGSPMFLKGNKTITGRDAPGFAVKPSGQFKGIRPVGAANWIVDSFVMDGGWDDWQTPAELGDAITLDESENFLINRMRFRRWPDGAVDSVNSETPSALNGAILRCRTTELSHPFNLTADLVSFGRNHTSDAHIRIPKNQAGRLSAFNNVLDGWSGNSGYQAQDGAQVLSVHDIFVPGLSTLGTLGPNGGRITWKNEHVIGSPVAFAQGDPVDQAFITLAAQATAYAKPKTTSEVAALRALVEAEAGPI